MKKMRQIEMKSRAVTPAAPMASKTTPEADLVPGLPAEGGDLGEL